jgi:hypothetical protein
MSARCSYSSIVTAKETLETNVDAASNPVVTHNGFNTEETLHATSTPPVTKVFYDTIALVAGAKTIDLTALAGTNGIAVDGTGLKVQQIKFRNRTSNAAMTFTEGASNGYRLGACTGWLMGVGAGVDEVGGLFRDTGPDIDGTHKTIDVAGTGTQSFDVAIWMG